mmetsp:Transcript_50338/g.109645  ORF Transcript_50338/g.109645 Transcript_50338/m.109645 type:complete len:209 (+) Transcript_50338:833-1459(+)
MATHLSSHAVGICFQTFAQLVHVELFGIGIGICLCLALALRGALAAQAPRGAGGGTALGGLGVLDHLSCGIVHVFLGLQVCLTTDRFVRPAGLGAVHGHRLHRRHWHRRRRRHVRRHGRRRRGRRRGLRGLNLRHLRRHLRHLHLRLTWSNHGIHGPRSWGGHGPVLLRPRHIATLVLVGRHQDEDLLLRCLTPPLRLILIGRRRHYH